jgi:hypothetical protein
MRFEPAAQNPFAFKDLLPTAKYSQWSPLSREACVRRTLPDETFLVEKESNQSIPETSNADHVKAGEQLSKKKKFAARRSVILP